MKSCYNCKIEKEEKEFSPSQFERNNSLCRMCAIELGEISRRKIRARFIASIDKKLCAKCNIEKDGKEFSFIELKKKNSRCSECIQLIDQLKPEKKKCSACNVEQSASEFSETELKKNWSKCRGCVSAYDKERSKTYKRKPKPALIIIEPPKECARCNLIKSIDQFDLIRKGSKIYKNECKECVKIHKKETGKINRQKEKKKRADYQRERQKDPVFIAWNREYKKGWRLKNRDRLNLQEKERRQNDLPYKLRKDIATHIRHALKKRGTNKGNKSISNFIEYTPNKLWEHLKNKFEPWMNENNYGEYDIKTWDDNDPNTWKWQLDHIIPQSDLPYTSMEDENFKKCWALENLRPYSAKQNIIDGTSRIRHKNKKE